MFYLVTLLQREMSYEWVVMLLKYIDKNKYLL